MAECALCMNDETELEGKVSRPPLTDKGAESSCQGNTETVCVETEVPSKLKQTPLFASAPNCLTTINKTDCNL